MCIFSARISSVANTRVFARSSIDSRQFLVYSMRYEAGSELAMILPLPTPAAPPEDAVRFIDLSGYPRFFEDMEKGFPAMQGRMLSGAPTPASRVLKVHEVGNFEASFVPRQADFARLDARFRLPENVWDQLPIYKDYSFAVFKLKAGAKDVHPMAFEFPRRNPGELFFPTVHVHHGKAERHAEFDHSLYCQAGTAQNGWETSWSFEEELKPYKAKHFMDIPKSLGLIEPESVVQKRRMLGRMRNEDVVLKL